MKQSQTDTLIFGSALAIVIGLTVAVSTSSGVNTDGSGVSGIPGTAFTPTYRGPSHNYAATPDTDSPIYD